MTASGSFDRTGDELLAALGEALHRTEPVPADVVEAAKASFAWRTIDAELAALTFDSLVDADALVGVRGGEGPRALTFERDDVVLDLEVTEHASTRSLLGHVTPTPLDGVEVQQAGGQPRRQPADAHGRFHIADLVAGPFRLRCRFGSARPALVTEWIVI